MSTPRRRSTRLASPARTSTGRSRSKSPARRKQPTAVPATTQVDAAVADVKEGDVGDASSLEGVRVSRLFKLGYHIRLAMAFLLNVGFAFLPAICLWYVDYKYDCHWDCEKSAFLSMKGSVHRDKMCSIANTPSVTRTVNTLTYIVMFNYLTLLSSIGVLWQAAKVKGVVVDNATSLHHKSAEAAKTHTDNLKYATFTTMQVFLAVIYGFHTEEKDKCFNSNPVNPDFWTVQFRIPTLLDLSDQALFAWLLVPFAYAWFAFSVFMRRRIFTGLERIEYFFNREGTGLLSKLPVPQKYRDFLTDVFLGVGVLLPGALAYYCMLKYDEKGLDFLPTSSRRGPLAMVVAALVRLLHLSDRKPFEKTAPAAQLSLAQERWLEKDWSASKHLAGTIQLVIGVGQLLFITLPFFMHRVAIVTMHCVSSAPKILQNLVWVGRKSIKAVTTGELHSKDDGEGYKQSKDAYSIIISVAFSWLFATATAIYAIFLFNIMFYLLTSAKAVEAHSLTTAWKIAVMLATGYNLAPGMSLFIHLIIDSWGGFSDLFLETMREHATFSHWVRTGTFTGNDHTSLDVVDLFQTMDVDNDGMVTREEFYVVLYSALGAEEAKSFLYNHNEKFDEMDKDGSGAVTLAEFDKWVMSEPRLAMLKERVDAASSVRRVEKSVNTAFQGIASFMALVCVMLVFGAKLQALEVYAANGGEYVAKPDVPGIESLFRGEKEGYVMPKREQGHFLNHTQPYAVCGMEWHALGAFDYSVLSALAYKMQSTESYENNAETVRKLVPDLFPERIFGDVKVVDDSAQRKAGGDEEDAVEVFDQFIQFEFPKQRLRVVAVRGTDPSDIADVLVDIRLWSESLMLNAFSGFFPLIRVMSSDTTSGLIYMMNVFQHFFQYDNVELDYHETVVRYVTAVKSKADAEGWKLAVTGHSLGGGISTIVGATLGIKSVAFSPPGLTRSRYKFETHFNNMQSLRPTAENAAENAVSFLPMHDVVPTADEHLGMVQHTMCKNKDPLKCHNLEAMVCDLMNRCGDGDSGTRFTGGQAQEGHEQLYSQCKVH